MDVYIVISKKGKVILHLFERDLTKNTRRAFESKGAIIKRKARQV